MLGSGHADQAGRVVKHGTLNAYNHHKCRCAPCRAVGTRYAKVRRLDLIRGHHRTRPAIGTTRRLRALAVAAWSARIIAERINRSVRHVQDLQAGAVTDVTIGTYYAVRDLYDELTWTPGPRKATRTAALKRGWKPALAWDDDTIDDPKAKPQGMYESPKLMHDEIAVLRAVGGDQGVHLSSADRAEAIAILTARGLTARAIAERMGLRERSVTRIRAVSRQQEYPEQVAS